MNSSINRHAATKVSVHLEKSREPKESVINQQKAGSVQEAIEELQSGEVVGHSGFVPYRFLEEHLTRGYDDDRNTSAQKIDELADKLVDRILVSQPSKSEAYGVQMKLVQNVFQGAEMWMQREKGGISLSIRTQTDASQKFLADRSEDLASVLGEKLNTPVKVAVELVL